MRPTIRQLSVSIVLGLSLFLMLFGMGATTTAHAAPKSVRPTARVTPYYQLCSAYSVVNVEDKVYAGVGVTIGGTYYAGSQEVWVQAAYDSVNTSYYCGLVRSSYYFYCGAQSGGPSFTMGTQMEALGGANSHTQSYSFGSNYRLYGSWVGEANNTGERGEGTPNGYGTIYYSK